MEKYINSKILAVDDEYANLFLLSGILKGEGYDVITADSGKKAIELLNTEFPDVVLLDINMPEMSGIEVIKIMHADEKFRDIPIIVVSARVEQEDVETCLNLGATDYIKKPIYDIELLARLRAALRLSYKLKELKNAKHELQELNKKLLILSEIDGLTGIFNRRIFELRVNELWRSCFREKRWLSLIMLDIDFFKLYNDTYGHMKGDECLKFVAKTIQDRLKRPMDFAARYGGEEFIIILPETNVEGALKVAEEIRHAIEDLKLEHKASTISETVTISVGVSSKIPESIEGLRNFLIEPDKALYKSKNTGRNRVSVYNPEDHLEQHNNEVK